MTTLREAAQQALEALEKIANEVFSPYDNNLGSAILALRAALAEPATVKESLQVEPVQEPKPVAWYFEARHNDSAWGAAVSLKHPGPEGVYMRKVTPLYTAPPQRPAEPVQESVPVGYLVSPHGAWKPNFNMRIAFPPEALDWSIPVYFHPPKAEPVQEPVAWMVYSLDGESVCVTDNPAAFTETHRALPLYTTPPQPQRKPLPKHDQHCVDVPGYGLMAVKLVRAVEQAHGIKE